MRTSAELQDMIAKIQRPPTDLEVGVKGLDERQLDTPCRQEGWTVRQVVHHLADARVNGFIPEVGEVTLEGWVTTLARHGESHLAQIVTLRHVKGW